MHALYVYCICGKIRFTHMYIAFDIAVCVDTRHYISTHRFRHSNRVQSAAENDAIGTPNHEKDDL